MTKEVRYLTTWHRFDIEGSPSGRVELRYQVREPLAITLVFFEPQAPGALTTTGTQWMVGRELFLAGLLAPAGDGDVVVELDPPWLVIRLASPDGTAVFHLDADGVRRFLAATTALIPRGKEIPKQLIDDELARLFSSP